MITWESPRSWQPKEALTARRFNRDIHDKIEYLDNRPSDNVMVPVQGANTNTTSTVMVAVNDALLKRTVETQGGDLLVAFHTPPMANSAAGGYVHLDLFIDDSYYLSSGTATALVNGILSVVSIAGYRRMIVPINVIVPIETPGEHTVSLHWRASGSTVVVYFSATPSYLAVMEV